MDIKSMLFELEQLGWSVKQIAKEARVHASSLSFIKTGARQDLYYSAGKRLETLYNKVISANKEA